MRVIYQLTDREQQIFEMMAAGWANGEIATQLGISPQTVKNHVASIYFKVGADSRPHAMIIGLVSGVLNPFVVVCRMKPQVPVELRGDQPEPAETIDFSKIRAIWE